MLAPQQRTLQFDRLSQRPPAPTGPGVLGLQTFTDQYTISDGNETIELYHVDGLNHSDNMLVAYLRKEKILINADLYTPPAQGAAAPANPHRTHDGPLATAIDFGVPHLPDGP